MNFEWIFDGLGTEIISFFLGTIAGVVGKTVHQKVKQNNGNKQIQKAGSDAIQIQSNGSMAGSERNGIIVASTGEQQAVVGDQVSGNKIVVNELEEFDLRNFSNYSNTQIEGVIEKGNNATRRRWCLELIVNYKPEYLIRHCIEKIDNDKEKYRLLEELAKRNFADSEYFILILDSITNAIYLERAIAFCLSIGKTEYIESIFSRIQNDKYTYESLIKVYSYNHDLFKKLYCNGNCFKNQVYQKRISEWLEQQKIVSKRK